MSANKRKRKADPAMKLAVDEKVEVRSVEEGLLGSWHSGTVIGTGEKLRTVQYDDLVNGDDGSSRLIEVVSVRPVLDGLFCEEEDDAESTDSYRGNIRPLPPPPLENEIHYGQCVDGYCNEAWWEGVVLDHDDGSDKRRIFFPDLGDEMGVEVDKLRLTQDWDELTGEWTIRGSWELLEKIKESCWCPGVSVRQIWFEMQALGKIEWVCSRKDVLKQLLLQVLSTNFSLFVKQVLHESSSAGEFVEENKRLVVTLSSGVEFSLEDKEVFREDKALATGPASSSSGSKRLNRKPRYSEGGGRLLWLTVFLEAEESPESITQYINSKRSPEITLSARKHLVYLGWEAQSARDKKVTRRRYISPEGVMYDSLLKACLSLQPEEGTQPVEKGGFRKCCIRIEGKSTESVMPKAKRTKRVSELMKKRAVIAASALKMVVHDKPSAKARKHLPKVLVEYAKLRDSMIHTRIRKDEETEKLTSEVKQHLTASGWTISRHVKGARSDALYVAPTGKKFYSLLRACEWCIGLVRSTSSPKKLDQAGEARKQEERKEKERKPVVKRVRQEATSSTRQTPRTVLSWLIDGNVILPREKVQYRNRKDGLTMKHGMISREGIKCSCCQQLFTLSGFEAHAGSNLHRPSSNIFLKDGRSLFQCQLQLKREESKVKELHPKSGSHEEEEEEEGSEGEDDVCTVCRDGGDILMCDQCPSAYHAQCLGLQGVPEGDWFCRSCCCTICGLRVPKEEEEPSSIKCGQCEHQYHIECLRNKSLVKPDFQPDGNWFCNARCEQIYTGLQDLLGKPIPVGDGDLTWTLLKYKEDDLESEHNMDHYGKLKVALSIFHESFVPCKDRYTGRDLTEDVIFSRRSDLARLNFEGFYTVALEKNDELISVANIRVYGGKVAEMPLVGTRFQYRRLGMCRILMNELEKQLMKLGVERLVLPAIPTMLKTWESSFGFSAMKDSDKVNFLDCCFHDFLGTTLCQKLLHSDSTLPSEIQNKMVNLAINNSVSEMMQEFQEEDNQEAADVSREGAKILVTSPEIQHRMHDLDISTVSEDTEMGEAPDFPFSSVSQGVEGAGGVHVRVPESQDTILEQENQLPIGQGKIKITNVYKRRIRT